MTLEWQEILEMQRENDMAQLRRKIEMVPGVRYKGTGCLTEFGEFDFTPENKGSRPNNMKLITETDEFSLYESKDFLKVSIKIAKTANKNERLQLFMKAYTNAILKLKKYDI